MSALETFEGLEAALAAAQERLREAHSRRRDAAQDLERAERELQEHVAAVTAGEVEEDQELLDRLYSQVRERQAVTSVRVISYPGIGAEATVVDLRGEAEVTGSQRAVEAAEAALRDYASGHLAELAVELASGPSAEVGVEALAALSAARVAAAKWNAVYSRWADVLRQAGALEHLQSSPVNPFDGLGTVGRGVLRGPTPADLV